MSFMPPYTRAKRLARKVVRGPKLPLALTGAILISLVLTGISVVWYSIGGYAKLDFSRPGYERERAEVRTTDTQKTYDTTSPVTKDAITQFLQEYDDRAKELSSYGNFSDNALDDNALQLTNQSGGSTQ